MRTIYASIQIPRILATRALRRLSPKAITGPWAVTRYLDMPDPPLPGPEHVRLRNRVGLICGSDMHMVLGEGDPSVAINALPRGERYYLGHEVCAEVVELGPDVTDLQIGDRVAQRYPFHWCATLGVDPPCRHCQAGNYGRCENQGQRKTPPSIGGGWGDGIVAHRSQLAHVPQSFSDDQIALLEPASVGLHVVLSALPDPGDQVLVIGCGTVGLAAIRVLRVLAPAAEITAMARHPFQAEMATRSGAHHVSRDGDGYDLATRYTGAHVHRGDMGSITALGGYDVVIDCVGSGRTLTDALRWTRAGGRVVLAGNSYYPLKVDLTALWNQDIQLIGVVWHGRETWQGERIDTFDLAIRLVTEGRLDLRDLITHRFPLSRWREAIQVVADKRSHGSIKVALDVD